MKFRTPSNYVSRSHQTRRQFMVGWMLEGKSRKGKLYMLRLKTRTSYPLTVCYRDVNMVTNSKASHEEISSYLQAFKSNFGQKVQ